MNGKELLFDALDGKQTSRPAWVPFVGCHGGKLIERSATEYLQSADLLVEGLTKACELYRPDGLPVMFDLQVEAEILGCDLHWADEVPPSVITHPLSAGKQIEDLPAISAKSGRFPIVLEALSRMVRTHGDDVAFYGLVCGPFTMALHLLGNDIFLEMYDRPDHVKRVIEFAADVAIASSNIYLDGGASVIAVVDPMTSQISAEHFAEFVTPSVNRVFDAINERGGRSSLFVCGDATRNLEEMCRTTANSISVDEQISLARLRELCLDAGKSFGGNIKLTAVLLLGNEHDARRETLEILDATGDTGFILSPGCDLPYATPPANLQAVSELVHDPYARDVARTASDSAPDDSFEDVTPPDYDEHKEVILDVITLDSTSCAPCQYMMEAVQQAAEQSFAKVFVNEHKIKARQGLGMMAKLGVKNLPTICIDGDIAFSSIIPDQNTLVAAIERHAIKKNITRVL
jgi:uroporphyrinogen decarboxylase